LGNFNDYVKPERHNGRDFANSKNCRLKMVNNLSIQMQPRHNNDITVNANQLTPVEFSSKIEQGLAAAAPMAIFKRPQ